MRTYVLALVLASSVLAALPPNATVRDLVPDILYSDTGQVNFRVPMELAGQDSAAISVATTSGTRMQDLRVVPSAPAVFGDLASASAPCFADIPNEFHPVARNEDGSRNSCDKPAANGSVVTLYLNGLGNTPPTISLATATVSGGTVLSVDPDPDSPAGVWRVRVRTAPITPVSYDGVSPVVLNLLSDGLPVRDSSLTVFVRTVVS